MNNRVLIWTILLSVTAVQGRSQDSTAQHSGAFNFKGQLSTYTHLNLGNDLPWWSGGRYIPQLNYELELEKERKIDFEASANIYGNMGLLPFDSASFNGDLKPYRIWARFSTRQFELRAGLQKKN